MTATGEGPARGFDPSKAWAWGPAPAPESAGWPGPGAPPGPAPGPPPGVGPRGFGPGGFGPPGRRRRPSRRFVGRMRAWLVFRGALGLVLGGLILLQPTLSLDAFALAVGVFFVIGGVARVVVGAAETHYAAGLRVLNVVVGALLVALGAASIRYPGFGLVATVAIIGFAWMMEGAATLAVLPPRHRGRGWAIAFGAVSLLAGAVVIVWPWAWLLPLLIVVGAALAVGGVFDIARAAKLRPGWGRRSVE